VEPSESIVRITVKPYGSALPLGFFSFGVGMRVLAGIGLGWVHGPDVQTAGILLAAFVFPLEFLATAIAFLARDTASAASLGLFSTSWLALGIVHVAGEPGERSAAVGLYLVMFGLTVLALAVAALYGKPLLAGLLALSAARAFLSAAWDLGGGHTLLTVSGATAVAIAGFALYGGLALLLEDLHQREVLPILRVGAARTSFEGGLHEQLERVEGEAGVRQQL
jgi:succinate-acetate transporter protein